MTTTSGTGSERTAVPDRGSGVVANGDAAGGARRAGSHADTYKSVYDGWKWWHVYCYRCHGVDAGGATRAESDRSQSEVHVAPSSSRSS